MGKQLKALRVITNVSCANAAFLILVFIVAGCGSAKKGQESVNKPSPREQKTTGGQTTDGKKDESGPEKYTPDWYINRYKAFAVKEMKNTGIPASITLAQGMLESNFGKSRLAKKGKNHFGIKCKRGTWQGGEMYLDDDAPDECFRTYETVLQSYHDHSKFLKSGSRYDELFELKPTNYKDWAKGLKEAGYATNPRYDDLLISVIERYDLHYYDQFYNKPYTTKDVARAAKQKQNDKQATGNKEFTYNGLKAYKVQENEGLDQIALKTGVKTYELIRYNDLKAEDASIDQGRILYLEPKQEKPARSYHVVEKGESLWDISQIYGVKLSRLYKRNRLEDDEQPAVGSRVFMRERRYKKIEVRKQPVQISEADSQQKQKANRQKTEKKPEFHLVKSGETMQEIANKYDMPVSVLYKKNRMEEGEQPAKGAKIHLIERRYVSPELKDPNTADAGKKAESENKNRSRKRIIKKGETTMAENNNSPNKDDHNQQYNNGGKKIRNNNAQKQNRANKVTHKKSKTTGNKKYHVVKSGESLYGIAKQYLVGVTQLKEWNNLDGNVISPGDKLIVKQITRDQKKAENRTTQKSGNKQSKNSTEKVKYHTVKSGETLYELSVQYDVPVSRIKALNNLEGSNLQVGEKLKIKKEQNAGQPSGRKFHRVEKGQTLFSIARKYDVSVKQLKTINDLENNSLQIGQKLYLEK